MRWSSEERAFAVEDYFSNRLFVIATQRTFPERPFRTGNQLSHGSLRSGKPEVRYEEELEYLGPSDHLRTLRQWEFQSCNPHDITDMPLPLDYSIVQWGEYIMMSFIAMLKSWRWCRNSPNVKDGFHIWCFTTFHQKVFLSSSLRASHLMFHYLSSKVFLSSSLRVTWQIETCQIKSNLDCNYTFPIDVALSGIPFGAKSIRKV